MHLISTKENRALLGLYETGMREIKDNGSTKLIDPLTTRLIEIEVEEETGKTHKAKIPSYKNIESAKTEEELLEFISYRFNKTQEEVSEILNLTKDSDKPKPVEVDDSIFGGIKNTWNKMNTLEKGLASGAAGLITFGLLAAMGGKENKKTGIDRQIEKRKQIETLYDSNTFKHIREKNQGHNRM